MSVLSDALPKAFLLCALLLVSACAMEPISVPPRMSINRPVAEVARGEIIVESESRASTTTLSLDEAIRTAILNNPSLKADYARFEAAVLEAPQVSSLMDPRVSYTQFVESVQTRTGEQDFIIGISQMFPWFGKLHLQGKIANTQAMQALESYRSSMLDLIETVTVAYHRFAYEQAALELVQQDKQITGQMVESAAALYATGQRGRDTLLKAQTELARLENELAGYPATITALETELARLLAVETVVVPQLNFPTTNTLMLPSPGELTARALAIRPELERLRLAVQQAELSHELARKDYYPDITFGVNYIGIGDRPDNPSGAMATGDEGDDAWNAMVGFNIPIPNARRRAAREQAMKEREQADLRQIAEADRIEQQIASVVSRLMSLDAQLSVLHENLVPLAEEAFNTSRAAYESGNTTFIELLDSQRTYIDVRRDILRVQRDYLLAIAKLERAVGGSLHNRGI